MRTRTESETRALWAEALFASSLQPSDHPVPAAIRAALKTSLMRRGGAGCAALLAQEYGEHPAEAAHRMRWVLDLIRAAYPNDVTAGRRRTLHSERYPCPTSSR